MSELEINGVTKSFASTRVLAGVDLAVPNGKLVALLGSSGSGKTTLLRILAGFDVPDAGVVSIDGEVVVGPDQFVPPDRRHIGYVPQEGALFPHLTVAQNVGFGVHDKSVRKARVAELLEMVGLEHLANRRPHQLSGGQRQRVALARALAPSPRLVLLDEPFSSLDPKLHTALSEEVVAVLRGAGTTSLLVTHDQDEALALADQVAVLREGRIVQVDTPHRLYELPSDPAIAAFVGVANFVSGSEHAGKIETPFGALAYDAHSTRLEPGESVVVLIRPEQLRVTEVGGGSRRARVVRNEFHGHDSLVHLELFEDDRSTRWHATLRSHGEAAYPLGTVVDVVVTGPVVVWPTAKHGDKDAARVPART